MNKYRKKPVVIEAIKFEHGLPLKELYSFFGVNDDLDKRFHYFNEDGTLSIKTLEGDHITSFGDYIIKGVKGEFYPCKPDIFEMTYEKVTE